MPRDRLALAILVRREQELVGVREALLQLGDDLLLSGIDDVVRLEAVVDVDTERAEPLALASGTSFARSGRSRMWPTLDPTAYPLPR